MYTHNYTYIIVGFSNCSTWYIRACQRIRIYKKTSVSRVIKAKVYSAHLMYIDTVSNLEVLSVKFCLSWSTKICRSKMSCNA